MAILVQDGFDLYTAVVSLENRPGATRSGVTSYTEGRFGGQALRLGNSGQFGFSFTASDRVCLGCALRPSGNVSRVLTFGETILTLWRLDTGALRLTRSTSPGANILLETPGGVFPTGAFSFVEVDILRNASAGEARIYVNGLLEASGTGLNTGAAAISSCGRNNSGAFAGVNLDVDDLYVTDSGPLGPCRIETISPASDSSVDWTPSGGADNYAMVSEQPTDGDATYAESDEPGDADLYGLSYGSTPKVIHAVQTVMIARNTDAGMRTVRCNISSSGTPEEGEVQALAESYGVYPDLHPVDPATSAAWTPTGVTAMLVGPEVVS